MSISKKSQIHMVQPTFIFDCEAWLMTINNKNIKIIGTFEKPWISGKELCEALGYKDVKSALIKNVKNKHKKPISELFEEKKLAALEAANFFWPFTSEIKYHEGKAVYISEHGAYHLAMKCELPIGDAFRDWLAEDVIPSIRKTGQYKLQQQLTEAMEKLVIEKQKSDDELKAAKEYNLLLKDLLVNADEIKKTQIIYISTSVNYARQNRFKIGGVESEKQLKSRLAVYNTRSASGDEWYYSNIYQVAEFRSLEARLKSLIGRFKDKPTKEFYIMHYNSIMYVVSYLCERYEDEVDDVNSRLSEFIESLNKNVLEPVVPDPCKMTIGTVALTELKADGTIKETQETQQIKEDNNEEFIKKVEEFIRKIPSDTTEMTKKEVFDKIKQKKRSKSKVKTLVTVFERLKPSIVVKMKSPSKKAGINNEE